MERSWIWQLKNAVRSVSGLKRYINLEGRPGIEKVSRVYPIFITPYYLEVARGKEHLLRMVVPSPEEVDPSIQGRCSDDPLEEERDSPLEGLTHRYPDRVLVVTTNLCGTLCRFCMRKRNWKKPPFVISKESVDRIVNYVRENRNIRDVIVSGGDPLMLPYGVLRELLRKLDAVETVDVVRIGTRIPVFLAFKVDDELLEVLSSSEKVWVNLHVNHPDEITPEMAESIRKLVREGIPVNSQTVLLKGINDSHETLMELFHRLQRIKVRPYYLFHCDPVRGTVHFSTTVKRGVEILDRLLGHTSPLSVPYYAVDGPGGFGKVQLLPNYIVSEDGDEITFRNYEGKRFSFRNSELPC